MTIAPYGTWKSPITADVLVASNIALSQPIVRGDLVYWKEGRPTEGGRNAIVCHHPSGSTEDVIEVPFNARTRVHEYGGADYLVDGDTVYFANFADQRLYVVRPGADPAPLTTQEEHRYADFFIDHAHNRLICVREVHSGDTEPVNDIAAVDLTTGVETSLAGGHDFFAYPRLSPDGAHLTWIAWDHPNMPWDATLLYVADVLGDALINPRKLAGGPGESIVQPEWSPDGKLHFVSDRSGYWNLYRFDDLAAEPVALCPQPYDFAQPLWQLGTTTYAFDGDRLIVTYARDGLWRLARIDSSGALIDIDTPIASARDLTIANGRAYLYAGFPTLPGALVSVELESGAIDVIKRSSTFELDPGYISVAEPVEFPTDNGVTAHAFFYPPRNLEYTAPGGELPPLLVMSHGGPTAATAATFSPRIQYWTSRGVAVLDVNYGGSTGYGRAYRERLNGAWGLVDVADCTNGALYMAGQGRVDPDRVAITGGSAGGYTTLAALTFYDVFRAGASHYGIGDLEALATDTHKFESRYLDNLIGPYPEARATYVERSPIHHTDQLSTPVIFFQGLEDRIVPPNQAETMVAALRSKGVPVAYFPFEGEQHGFRRAENIKRSLEAELLFYGRIFGFQPADDIEPFEIENL